MTKKAIIAIALALAVGAFAIDWWADSQAEHLRSGKAFAEWLVARAAKDGSVDLTKESPRLCFIGNYWSQRSCEHGCFKSAVTAKIRYERDASDGFWFAGYEIPERNLIFFMAVPQQPKLVWDVLKPSPNPLKEDRCGIVEAVRIQPVHGTPAIAAELPGIFPAGDVIYNEMTPSFIQ